MSSVDEDLERGSSEFDGDLREYVEQNRDDLEALASGDYPVSGVVQALLDRFDRGDL